MKKYIAKTNVSINVVLQSGKNRHITFSALTGGGSVFYTDDPDIQKAMERHYKFGKLFRIDHMCVPEKQRTAPAQKSKIVPEPTIILPSPTPIGVTPLPAVEDIVDAHDVENANAARPTEEPITDSQSEEESDDEESGLKTIVVSDPDAAKAYLAEHFSISRTKLKSIKSIMAVATANGIRFEGLGPC